MPHCAAAIPDSLKVERLSVLQQGIDSSGRRESASLSEPKLRESFFPLTEARRGYGPVEFEMDPQSDDLDDDDRLERWIHGYVTSTASPPTLWEDVERFLLWLSMRTDVEPNGRDALVIRYSCSVVESSSLSKRLSAARFLQMLPETPAILQQAHSNSEAQIYLNPTYVWAQIQNPAQPEHDECEPADALFYQVRGEVRFAVLSPQAVSYVRLLASERWTIGQFLARRWSETSDDPLAMLRLLGDLQIIAVA